MATVAELDRIQNLQERVERASGNVGALLSDLDREIRAMNSRSFKRLDSDIIAARKAHAEVHAEWMAANRVVCHECGNQVRVTCVPVRLYLSHERYEGQACTASGQRVEIGDFED